MTIITPKNWSRWFTGSLLLLGMLLPAIANAQQMPEDTIAILRSEAAESRDHNERLGALWALTDIYRNQGKLREAYRLIDDARLESETEAELTITALRRAGIALGLGLVTEAESLLFYVRDENRFNMLDSSSQIVWLLEDGNFHVEEGDLDRAVDSFQDAAVQAANSSQFTLQTKATINALRANMDNQNLSNLEPQLEAVDALLRSLPSGDEKALLAAATGDLFRRAVTDYLFDRRLLLNAYDNYQLARSVATSPAMRAYAYGLLGELYESDERLEEAVRFTNQAIFYAQEAGEPEQHYRWEWQLARILRSEARALEDAAIEDPIAASRLEDLLSQSRASYERAVAILNEVRSNFVLGSRDTFDTLVGPVYTEYADILMLQAAASTEADQQQAVLRQVRTQLEDLKTAEVEDYLANQCAVNTDFSTGPGARAETKVAVVYPLILDDRIEVVIEAAGEIRQYTVPEVRGRVTQAIRRLRLALENPSSGDAYLGPAQDLYDWLIRDSLPLLEFHGIKTLMIVPGGALRTIPLSALHDGDQFLIEKYAVATTPAIGLTETSSDDEPNASQNLLVGGLTEGVQGFDPLPNVGRELDRVTDSITAFTRLEDTSFQLAAIQRNLESPDFTFAHFATHGQFSADYTQSFILTYDDRLTLDNLRTILTARGDNPLDLLVLSACETAAGDDRAALGLAGVAVQSGAKSVVASLWRVNDAATTELISTFYQNLNSDGSGKGASLQTAQKSLLATEQWRHPAFWAPFLLIGNWQ